MKILILFFVIVFSAVFSYGLEIGYIESKGRGGFPGEYLTTFSGNARALAMGKAYTGLADDSAGIYWNPAGIFDLIHKDVNLLYTELFEGVGYHSVSYAHPFLKYNVLGISMVGIKVDELQETNIFGRPTGQNFSVSDAAYTISYARKLYPHLGAGINFRIVSQNILDHSAIGYGIDIGTMWLPKKPAGLRLGVTIQNALPPSLRLKHSDAKKDVFPVNLRSGASYRLLKDRLILAADYNLINLLPDSGLYEDGEGKIISRWHTGVEYNLPTALAIFSFRAGIDYKEVSAGFGIRTRFFSFNYAAGAHYLGITHRFGVSAHFGMLPTEQEAQLQREWRKLRIERSYQKALMYFNKDEYNKSNKWLEKCFEDDPDYKPAIELQGKIRLFAIKKEARELYNNALIDFEEGRSAEAHEKIKKADGLYPELKTIIQDEFYQQAGEYMDKAEYEKCRLSLRKLLHINPEHIRARELLRKLEGIMEFME